MKSQTKKCRDCDRVLTKDEVALNKKLISPDVQESQCLDCMSESFGCDVADLKIKIDEFKEQGCTLFI
jgi:hypothetical protein